MGVNGLLVSVDDVGALTDAMAQLMDNATLAARLAEGGRASWEAGMSPSRVTSDWVDFLTGVSG